MTALSTDELVLVTHPDFDPHDGDVPINAVAVVSISGGANDDNTAFRVRLTDNQSLVGFSKFGTIGVGFDIEDDGNTNLPYAHHPDVLLDHISHNRTAGGDDDIPRELVAAALDLIREGAARLPAYGRVCWACRDARLQAARSAGTRGPVGGDDHWVDACPVGGLDGERYGTGGSAQLHQYDDYRLPSGWPDKDRFNRDKYGEED